MSNKWTKEELTKLIEMLIEVSNPIISHPSFRSHLDRNENLFTNQIIRTANGNIAYRSIDCDVDNMSDEDFWNFVDNTRYAELIEENAAVAIMKMVEKLDLNN